MASKVSPERSERGRVVIQQISEERFAGSHYQLLPLPAFPDEPSC